MDSKGQRYRELESYHDAKQVRIECFVSQPIDL